MDTNTPQATGIRCWSCGKRHATIEAIRDCHDERYFDDAMYRQEDAAENAWLRAAEAGNPDSWAEEDRERWTEIYGIPPAF